MGCWLLLLAWILARWINFLFPSSFQLQLSMTFVLARYRGTRVFAHFSTWDTPKTSRHPHPEAEPCTTDENRQYRSGGPSAVPVCMCQSENTGPSDSGKRRYSAYCLQVVPICDSDFTGTIAGNLHYRGTTSALGV